LLSIKSCHKKNEIRKNVTKCVTKYSFGKKIVTVCVTKYSLEKKIVTLGFAK